MEILVLTVTILNFVAYFPRDSKATQSLEPFFPSTGSSKTFFSPNPAAYIQNAENEFPAPADESAIAISNENNLFETYTNISEEEGKPESISFIVTTTLMKEGNTENTDATGILENNTTLFDVPDMEDKNIIKTDTTYLERYGKIVSNTSDLPQKDNSIVMVATDMKNHNTTTVNIQTPSISSEKNRNYFEFIPILRTSKADTNSVMIATDIDEAISNINPINSISNINSINSVSNYKIYMERKNFINNSDDTKTMLDVAKNMMHVGDLIIFKTNDITSTEHYANPNPKEPMTNSNVNFKITWPSKDHKIIEGKHTVQKENIITPNYNNIAEATGSNVGDLITEYHSNIPVTAYLKMDRNNFKSVNTDEIEFVIPMDQDDEVVEEVIFIHPDISTTEMKRKIYSLNPDAHYGQTRGDRISFSDISNMFNFLFKYEMKPFAMDSTNLIDNRGDQRTPTILTINEAKAKMDVKRTTMVKNASFQSHITPVVSMNHPATVESVDFGEDSVTDMISTSKFNITPLNKSTDSVNETISFSTNNNHIGGGSGPNLKANFPMHKGFILLPVAESPALMSNTQNNQDENSLQIKDNTLTGAWISYPVTENSDVINDTIIQKWKIDKLSVDPLNLPLESTFLTADFTSPNDLYNVTASESKETTNTIVSSDPMINKATISKGRPNVTMTSLFARTAGILTPRQRLASLIDKEIANKEESTPFVGVKSVVEDDAVFQVKDLPPAHNFKYFQSGDSGFERNGSVAIDTAKSLFQLNSIIPIAEVTLSERDLANSGEEKFDVLYDVITPANNKIHFKTMAPKTIVNGSGGSATVKQNVETAEGTEFFPPSSSTLQIGRMNYHILPNLSYNVISDNPLTITKENRNLPQNIMKHKLSLFTMDNAYLFGYGDSYQTPIAVTSSSGKRLTKENKMAGTKITKIPLGITTVADDISYVYKNTEIVTDLDSVAATSPIKDSIMIMKKDNTFKNNSNNLGDYFILSREDLNVSRDDGTLLTADSSTFMKSVDPLQAINPIKKASLADIIIPKTSHTKSTPSALTEAVTTASQRDVDTMFYIPRYESENSFKKEITLNYKAHSPKDIGIMPEKEDKLKEENVRDHIYVVPTAGDNIPKGNNLAAEYYSLNSGVRNSIRFKETTKTTADQLEFEKLASSHITEISKTLLEKLSPEFQEKVIVRNSKSGAKHDSFFGGDILYPMLKGYTLSPKIRSNFTISDIRISMKDNTNLALENTALLGKGTSRKNYSSYIHEKTDSGTEKDQITRDSITNFHTSIIPMTFSTPVSSEDINVENHYHVSETGTPLSLRYANILRDDYFIFKPVTIQVKGNNVEAMDLIIMEPNQSDSEYISKKHSFEIEREENNSVKKPIQLTHGHNRFVSHIPSSKDETSKSLLYRITQSEFKTKDKYQTILKEENFDSAILARSFKDYTKNINTQHLKTLTPSSIDADKTFSLEFQEKPPVRKNTLNEDDIIIILPEVSFLGNKKIKYLFIPHTETITMGESTTYDSVLTDHTVISIPIKSQDQFYRKGISSNIHNTAALELANSIISEKSEVNESKMDSSEVMPSGDHINLFVQDIASQVENISYVGEVIKDITQTASIASLNPFNTNEMSTDATISHSPSVFDSKESTENGESIKPAVDSILLKSLLIPNQKRPTTAIALNENDDSLSDKSLVLKVSKPLGEDSTITDQNIKVKKVQSDPRTFSIISTVPLEDPATFSEKPINLATEIPTIENVNMKGKTDSMAFIPNIALQPIIQKKVQINKTSDHVLSHRINNALIEPSAKENTTSETEANAFLREDIDVVEDESHISEAKIPVNLRDVNAVSINPFIIKPDVASAEHKAPGTLKEIFYPSSTMSKTNMTQSRTRSSFSFDNANLERPIINSYDNLYHLPLKSALHPTDFATNFININHSELNTALNMRENNIKMTYESIISNDKEIISPDNITFMDDKGNLINKKRYIDYIEKDNVTQYEDFSAESDVVVLAGENNPNNINVSTVELDGSTLNYVSKENTFYVGEEGKSHTAKTPTFIQGLYRFGAHAPFLTAHVTESLLNENPVELKTKQKQQMLISRKENPDSYEDGSFLKEYTSKFKSMSPRTMTDSLTDTNKNISPKFPNDLALEHGTLCGNTIATILPESKWTEQINAPELKSIETEGENRSFPDEIIDLTVSATAITSTEQRYRRYVTYITFYDQRKPTILPKSEYNQEKTFKVENYHSQDVTAPSVTLNVNLDNELPFDYEDSKSTENRASTSSAVKTAHTMTDTPTFSLQKSYKGDYSMQPDENNISPREFPFLLTTENVILMPEVLNEDSVLMNDNFLTDSSKSVLGVSETVTEYLDLTHGTDISRNQDIQLETDLQPHSLDSNISHTDSITFTRNSTNNEAYSTSTVERDTVNSKVKINAQSLNTIMQVLSPRQRSLFLSEIRKMAELPDQENTAAKFDLSPIKNLVVLIPTLEKALLSTPNPSSLSKSNNNKEEELSISGEENFVLEGSRTLEDISFIGKFNTPAGLQAPPNIKRIHSADSIRTLEKTRKLKNKNSASSDEESGTAGLLHNVSTGTYELPWKSTFSPDFTTFVSSSKYVELDPVIKMKKNSTTKTNDNFPFEEENIPSHKAIISPSTNILTKDILHDILNKRFANRYLVGKNIMPEYEVVSIIENTSDITLDGKNIPNNEYVVSTVLDDRALEYVANEYVLEPQEGKNHPIIKKTTFNYAPKIVWSHPFYSNVDTSKFVSQGAPTKIKTREKITSSYLDAIVPQSSTDNLSYRDPKAIIHSLSHTNENFLKFLGKTSLKRDTFGEGDTIIILPEDKKVLVPDSEIIVTMVEGRMFPGEPIDPTVNTSPLKNKNQFNRNIILSATYNADAQSEAENILLPRVVNVKGKTNMAEMQHSWDSIIPLADFSVISDSKFPFTNEENKILNDRASIYSSPMNTAYTMEDITVLTTESNYEGDDSMLPEDNSKSRRQYKSKKSPSSFIMP